MALKNTVTLTTVPHVIGSSVIFKKKKRKIVAGFVDKGHSGFEHHANDTTMFVGGWRSRSGWGGQE